LTQSIPPEARAELSGKRFALIGFTPEEAALVCASLEPAEAFCRSLSAQQEGPDSPGIRGYDVFFVKLSGNHDSPWEQQSIQVRAPVLFAGSLETMMRRASWVPSFPHTFLVWPAKPEELILRAVHLLIETKTEQKKDSVRKREKPLVVVADDDPTTTTLLNKVLQRYGMECQTASDGEAALQLARDVNPDAMVLDVNMPYKDGFEVLSAIKKDKETSDVKVLMLTSLYQETEIIRGFGLGADDYVTKPFNPIELVARLKRLLPKP
jgi:CheY-like chemotaxis protein